ncbi:MAG TPA: hypothetical protein VLB73_00330 [Patescibacteria group bacterium]|nr:hypothetical protein [Patescibacteria group bacterium]
MVKLPKSLTRVTSFSKLVALFVILGFLLGAFYAGILFQKNYGSLSLGLAPTPTPFASDENACTSDSDCVLADLSSQGLCCPNTKCADFSQESVRAVSSAWLTNHTFNQCKGRMCPMIMVICTRNITEENKHYNAKCISHVCTKVRS